MLDSAYPKSNNLVSRVLTPHDALTEVLFLPSIMFLPQEKQREIAEKAEKLISQRPRKEDYDCFFEYMANLDHTKVQIEAIQARIVYPEN
jgi:hypothetical protein